ncbi:MAG: membrane dipeptidase [Thermoanaerobaculia bacterium]
MTRRRLLRAAGAAAVSTFAGPLLGFGRCRLEAEGPVLSVRAVDLVHESTVVDMLGLLTMDWPRLRRWQSTPREFTEGDYRGLERSGIDVFHPAVEPEAEDPVEGALRWIERWGRLLSRGEGCYLDRVESAADLLRIPAQGKLGVIVGFQNSTHFRAPADVERFFRLGQRVSQLTYNDRNRLGAGCRVEDRGLTAFGREIVSEMNRVGMAVDISHCGERTSRDAIALSRRPVLVTHSNCRALAPGQPRCKSDEILRLVAAGGGVIGLTVVRAFVGGRGDLARLLDHFDHVAGLVGPEHAGLGSDVDLEGVNAATGLPSSSYRIDGLSLSRRVFQIADGLLGRGWTESDVAGVLGGNFLRALSAIWPEPRWPPLSERWPRRDPFCPAPGEGTSGVEEEPSGQGAM